MKESKTICLSISFTDEDILHCISCINAVRYLLDSESYDESFSISFDDIKYLASLLSREYNLMLNVVQASEGLDNDI